MPETPNPIPQPSPADAPVPAVDSVTLAAPSPIASEMPLAGLRQARKKVLLIGGIAYGAFVLWCAFLLLALPDPTGRGQSLLSIGVMTSLLGVLVFIAVGALLLKRISASPISIATRRQSLLKLIAVLVPGILLGAVTPVMIIREPALPLDIVQPTTAAEFVAPVAVTLSAERAVEILKNLGYQATKFQWDTDGDGKLNDETIVPTITVLYERQGTFPVVARIVVNGGAVKRVARRVTIPSSVFSVVPVQPIVQRPVKFSVAGLLTDPKALTGIEWNFGDGNATESMTVPDAVHTYYAVGDYEVTAVMRLQNQSQLTFRRTISVKDPAPLPFPVALVSEPKSLVGPSPFGVLLRIETTEPLQEVHWNFGDGKEDRGVDIVRQSHQYDAPGIYPVIVRVRSESGELAELTSIIRVTETLTLRDLQFEGSPAPQNSRLSGEVPLEINLTPKTSTPLVQFTWEIPDALELQESDGALQGVLRTEGKYTVTLMAQGAEGKSMRMPLTIEVLPPSAEPTIVLTPDGGTAPLTVTFDASRSFVPPGETVAGFKWLFGDEGQGNRSPQLGAARVEHVYTQAGEYVIQLSVVLTSGQEFTTQRTIIVRKPTLTACVTASRLNVQVGKGVEFSSSCSTGEWTSLIWDVRNDEQPDVVQAQSGDARYVYVFDRPGTYTVTLMLKDAGGVQEKKSVSLTVTP